MSRDSRSTSARRPSSNRLKDQPILLVADSTLKDAALAMLADHSIHNVTVLHDPIDRFSRPKYETPDEREARLAELHRAKAEADELICSTRWGVMISHYQEFLFKPNHLQTTLLPLNIHPSTETIPGMVYDTWPLVEGTASTGEQGATLHFMTPGIDQGPIVRVLREPVAPDATYMTVRRRNQQLCMDQLRWLCGEIADAGDVETFEAHLMGTHRKAGYKWGTYVNTKQRDAKLLEIHRANPNHPVLVGNAKFDKKLAWEEQKAAAKAAASTPEQPVNIAFA
ncbi:MAG: hypothetical protein U0136_09355 [Bdellovibrionota bacterium]